MNTSHDIDFIIAVLKLVDKYDFESELEWNEDLEFFINCNDFFHWGCSDAEPVTQEDLALLEKSVKDDNDNGPLLYCARKRGMRPQGAYYEVLGRKLWQLFDACGPEREIDLGNPKSQNVKGS